MIEKIIARLEEYFDKSGLDKGKKDEMRKIVQEVAQEYTSTNTSTNQLDTSTIQQDTSTDRWIPVEDGLPESEDKYGWVSCIVTVNRSHYPTSSYDICDAPYDETIVMKAHYHVPQKIWHLECDEHLNALMDIEDAPLNGDYVIAWMELPAPYQPKGEKPWEQ